jgi:pyruvate dehydrogenase E1 component alpha subunit
VFVCEDNKWAISVPKSASTAIPSNADRAAAYGMPGVLVERNDAVEVCIAAGEAVARARRGEGPTLIEVKTDRYLGHFQGDPEVYRPKGEVAELRKSDPIPKLSAQLRDMGILDDASDAALVARVKKEVADAYTFAIDSPYPALEEALQHVFV